MERPKRAAHLTSAHARYDTRIFLKMCRSLAATGLDVVLVVADGKGDETRDSVRIIDAGASRGRLDRMAGATRRVFKAAVALDADIYHIHDPELLPAGISLKRRGKTVIFDAHEDLPRQILSKPYLPAFTRRGVSIAADRFERYAFRRIDHVVGATPSITTKIERWGIPATCIKNYPLIRELDASSDFGVKKLREICYVGGISRVRGIRELVAALDMTISETRLNMAGVFSEVDLKIDLTEMAGWRYVNELGFLSRSEVRDVLSRSLAGIVTLHPTPAYIHSLPIKMFEYMSAGIPVIASNFPLWREIVEGNDCGICVDPLDPSAIAAAIDRLVEDPDLARRMGENGHRAVAERYNWSVEEQTLLALYRKLLDRT